MLSQGASSTSATAPFHGRSAPSVVLAAAIVYCSVECQKFVGRSKGRFKPRARTLTDIVAGLAFPQAVLRKVRLPKLPRTPTSADMHGTDRTSYKFDIVLCESKNPTITRTVDVPAWWTFRQLHYVLQYSMGPWQCSHLHEFRFTAPNGQGRTYLDSTVMTICGREGFEDDGASGSKLLETNVKLNDVWETGGKHAALAPCQLIYEYDFGMSPFPLLWSRVLLD